MSVTIRDEGEFISGRSLVERLRDYSVGKLPDGYPEEIVARAQGTEPVDDGRRIRVAEVKVDGVWVPL